MKKALILLLLLPFQILAQQFAADLQKQLDAYYQSYIPLKVHVFTNQPEYAAGDTIFFKVNLVTAQGHRPVRGKSILSAALLNANEEKILLNGFSVNDGQGSNQMILPRTLPHGDYHLTVWSDWMTENKSLQYRKLIRIGTGLGVRKSKKLFASPEGGNLIHGLNTRVVAMGEPSTQGSLNENGIQILQFTIGADGTSSFYLTPKKNFHYELVAGEDRFPLPEIKEDGIGILVTSMPSKNSTRVYLTAPEQSDYRNKTFHLIVSMQGIIYQSTDIVFKNQSYFALEVPMQKLPQGIAQVTLLDDQRNAIVERLIYNSQDQTIATSLTLSKNQFNTRERIDLKINTSEGSVPVRSKIALTTFNTTLTPVDTTTKGSMQTDLFLHGDTGFETFSFSTEDNASTIDNKLILSKWARFDWKNLSKRSDNAYYSQYMRFSGRAFDIETNKPVPDSTKITFFMHKNVNTYQTYTNEEGEFTLHMLFEFYDTDEVYYRVEQKRKLLPNAKVIISESRVVSQESANQEKSITSYNTLFDKRKMINESYDYHTNASRSFVPEEVEPLIEEEIFGPDITIKLEDYHLFPTMIETLREIIPFSQHRRIRGNDVVRIFNADTDLYWEAEPVYVIDGVMTDDTDYFLSLAPADIATIKIVHTADKLRTFGTIGNGGMVIVDTKIPDNHKNVHRSVRSFTLHGLNQPLTRGTISHNANPRSRIPDLRTNLAWLPAIETNGNGEAAVSFYTSDVPGKYRIEGEGITSDGKLFSFQQEFVVIFEK